MIVNEKEYWTSNGHLKWTHPVYCITDSHFSVFTLTQTGLGVSKGIDGIMAGIQERQVAIANASPGSGPQPDQLRRVS